MGLFDTTVLAYAGIAALVYIVVAKIQTYLKLRHIKGPRGTGWSIFWLTRHQLAGHLPTVFVNVVKKYGPIARIGPTWVVVSSPSEIRRIWSVRSGYDRSPWYKGFRFDPNEDSVLTASDNKEHHRIRSKILPAYSGKGLGNQEAAVDQATLKLVELIEREYLSAPGMKPRLMDGERVFQFFSQDANSIIEFGQSFEYLERNSDYNGIAEAFEMMMPVTNTLALFPPLLWLVKTPLVKPFLPKPTDPHGVGRLLGVVQGLVEERYSEGKEKEESRPRDVLSAFMNTSLTQKEVVSESLVHLLGGTDTTATALRMIVFYLATKPSAYRALQNELDRAVREGRVTRPIVADAEAKSIPYLQGVIKEAMRLWPPIQGMMAKSSPNDDVICGQKVPAGTNVAWAAWAVMKDPEVFGDDAEIFEPRRWIDAWKAAEEEGENGGEATARLKEMEAVQSMVFVVGSRWECLGKRLAYVEMGKVLFELFLRYDFSMADPVRPFEWINYGFTINKKMNFVVTKRESVSS